MKDENGRGVIRLHDKTTHGGEVITACDDIRTERKHAGSRACAIVCISWG